MRRNAFTLTEVIIAGLVLGIMASAMTLSTGSARQTAKREAERIVTQLYRLIERANRTHISFRVYFKYEAQTDHLIVKWQTAETSLFYDDEKYFNKDGHTEKIEISRGCSVQNIGNTSGSELHNLRYGIRDNCFLPPSMTLKVTGQDNSIYYIIISSQGARIRTSDTKP